jgi:hypothetical protein
MRDAPVTPQYKESSMDTHVSKSNGHSKKRRGAGADHSERTLSHGEPAEPLLEVLPIKRWVPQDVHSLLDYANGLSTLGGYYTSDDEAACWASLALGASVIGVSAITDYRLSLAKIVPIRVHESLDYAWGLSAIALPFVLGYWKSSPRTALMHIVAGAGSIVGSLFTDYRSYKQERAEKRARARSQADLSPIMPT